MTNKEAEKRFRERIKRYYPPGTRIILLSMGDDPHPVEDNTRGTVRVVDDLGTLHCDFDIMIKTHPTEFDSYIALGLFIVSTVAVILFAPVEHPNKPFIKTEKERFRKLSCFYSVFVIIIGIIFLIINDITFNPCVLSFAFGTFSAATALTIAKLKYKKEENNL
ncbi:MAG: DUF4314 domain-containing protein [Clostridiales bacterium]|nr:DUF4314 domain-containing protein [Clostridiales bacterium]